MRLRLLLLAVLFRLNAGDTGLLRLLNGDSIQGSLNGLERGRLLFHPSGSATPLVIPARLAGWFSGGAAPPDPGESNVRVEFNNGDVLIGTLLSLEEDLLRVRTPWGEDIAAATAFLKLVEILPPPASIPFLSRGVPSSWTVENPRLFRETSSGLFTEAPNSMSRTLRSFPERFRVKFQIQSRERHPAFSFHLFSRRHQSPDPDSFSFQFQGETLMIFHHARRRQDLLLRTRLEPLDHAMTDLTLYGDLTRGQYQLFVNGQTPVNWTLPTFTPGAKARPAIAFSFTRGSFEMQALEIRSWAGAFPGEGPAVALPPEGNHLRFRNGDIALFQSLRGEGTQLHFRTAEGQDIEIPLEALDRVSFATGSAPPPRRGLRDIQVTLSPHGNRLTLTLDSLDGTVLTGSQDLWRQPLRIPMSHVQNLRFNIHHPHRFDTEAPRLTGSLGAKP